MSAADGLRRATACVRRALLVPMLVLVLALAPATAASAAPLDPADAAGELVVEQAIMADRLVDAVGVNTHSYYRDTPYTRDYGAWRARLLELGVRHVRENLAKDSDVQVDRLKDLRAEGIRASFVLDPREAPVDTLLARLRSTLASEALQLEGPNELENAGWQGTSRDGARAYQKALFAKVKADPALAHLPVLCPGVAYPRGYVSAGGAAWGDLKSGFCDQGNLHSYPGGRMVSADPGMRSNLHEWMTEARKSVGSKPLQVTETGYHNALGQAGGHRPASRRTAALYLPRLHLEHARQGIVRGFTYELIDSLPPSGSAREANFGLLDWDLRPKPAFSALKDYLAVNRDPGPAFTPGKLAFTLSATRPDFRHLLAQRRDGTFLLWLWREVSLADPAAHPPTDLPIPADVGVTVSFDGRTARRVAVSQQRPDGAIERIETAADAPSAKVGMSPRATVLEISLR